MCRPFKETGECKYGEKCQFAHGENELRNVQRHPKYKTEYCRTFYGVGLCPYGSRCHFLHDLSDNDDNNTRPHGNRANRNENSTAATASAAHQTGRQFIGNNKDDSMRMGGHTNGFGRGMTSAEVDAITKTARYIGVKDEAMPIVSRTFGRSASLMNTNSVASVGAMHPLPMSPPLSMSTGSDRASPICSLSPTNSIANFPFTEPNLTFGVNNLNNGLYTSGSLVVTPPASPPAMMTVTPPPTPILTAAAVAVVNSNTTNKSDKPRLPIFNQISCANPMDTLKNLSM